MKLASTVTVFVGGAVAGPGGAVVGRGLELLGDAVGAGSWNLHLGRRRRIDDQDERAGALLGVVQEILRRVASEYRGVSVLVDGLDRLTDVDAIRIRRLLDEEGLDEKATALLRKVASERSLPDADSVPHLLRNWWLMPHPNNSVWWQPHPLLMISALAGAGRA